MTVLVVGAGPTGLVLACDLARRGVPVRIIDKAPRFAIGSRGKGLQPRTIEVLDDLGVVDRILAGAPERLVFRQYRGAEVIREIDLNDAYPPTPDVPYPRLMLVTQWSIEQILRDRLASLGVSIELGSELIELRQTGDAVVATIAGPSGTSRVEVGYLVGCDGGRSGVRKSLGIDFVGKTVATEQLWIGDVEVEGLSPDAWHQWFTPEHVTLLCPLPGTSAWQLQATPLLDAAGQPAEPSLEVFQRILDERTGLRIRLFNPTWISTYRTNVRMVDRLRVGRVLLAGDAAHVHPIAGGLGLNTGIQDAYNLGWKLDAVLAGAPDALLDTYAEERLPIAAWTLGISTDSQRAMAEGGRVDAGLTADTRQLGLHYRWSSLSTDLVDRTDRLRAGDRAPDAPLGTGRLFDVFRGPHATVLGFGKACAAALSRFDTGVRSCLVGDQDDAAFRIYQAEPGTLMVVRPDGYLAMTAGVADTPAVAEAVTRLATRTGR
jgi:2-polyprenyl-6-methoxyphenol hydroxylase-like FAD-dependent oxidoreductase